MEYSHLLFAKLWLCNLIACPNAIHWKQDAMCCYIYLGSFREPTRYAELLAILQRPNSIKMVANDEDWDTIPRTHILVRRGKVLEDALREVRKDRFDPTKLLNVSSCNFIE